MHITVEHLQKTLKFLVEAYKTEAKKSDTDTNEQNNNQQTVNLTDTESDTDNEFVQQFDFSDVEADSTSDNSIAQTSLITDEQIKEQITYFSLLKKIRDIIFIYLRLKNLIMNQPSYLAKLNNVYINQFYELELILEYLLINFRAIEPETLKKYLDKIENFVNELAIQIYAELNKV